MKQKCLAIVFFVFLPFFIFASEKKDSMEICEKSPEDKSSEKKQQNNLSLFDIYQQFDKEIEHIEKGYTSGIWGQFFSGKYNEDELFDILVELFNLDKSQNIKDPDLKKLSKKSYALHSPFLACFLSYFSDQKCVVKIFSDKRLSALNSMHAMQIPQIFCHRVVKEICKKAAKRNMDKNSTIKFSGTDDITVTIDDKKLTLFHPDGAAIKSACFNKSEGTVATLATNGDVYVWRLNGVLRSYISTGLSFLEKIVSCKNKKEKGSKGKFFGGQHFIVEQKFPEKNGSLQHHLLGRSFRFNPVTFAMVTVLNKFKDGVYVPKNSWLDKEIYRINNDEFFHMGYPSRLSCEKHKSPNGTICKIALK